MRKRAPRESDSLWDWNLTFNRIHFSPGWASLVGCERDEVGNTPDDWFQRVHPDDSERLHRDVEALRSGGSDEFELRYRLRHKDGTYRWMCSRGLVVRNSLGEPIRLTGSQADVTVDTVSDPLTGLPNQLLLRERLAQSIERTRRHPALHFALLLIDLGHPAGSEPPSGMGAGDPLLHAAARRLETCLRIPEATPAQRQHDLVARVEGQVFAVLLDGLEDLGHAQVVAERMLDSMLFPFTVSGREVRLTAAIGMAVSATGYTQADDALRDARTALHRAHVLGGSHVEVFDTGVLRLAETSLQLEGEFDTALQHGAFQLVYQPVISMAANRIVGFEALVRWQHPALGTVSPLEFIPLAERTGFIVPLGEWILREACQQMRAWQTDLPGAADLWMSVNLSGVQFRHPALVEHIGQAVRDSGLPPGSLVLELTEGTAMDNPAAVTTLLMQLRATGIRISIDDFGTGYSSLAYLTQFPVDALKIDRSFVRRLAIDPDTLAIVSGMISMARQLGLDVVAEGVEHEEQLAALRSLQCDAVQGYLLARPLDAAGVAALLTTGLPAREERPGRTPAPARVIWARVCARMRRPLPPRSARLAGVAVVAVLMCAGVVALNDAGRPAVGAPEAVLPQGASRGDTTAAGEAGDAATSGGSSPGVSAGTAAQPVAAAQPPAAASPAEAPAASKASQRPPAPAAFDVVHLHRLGSCRGRLTVSRDGIAYTPEEGSNDAFVLTHAEFLHTLERDSLTIRSSRRTYRFEAGAASTRDEQTAALARLAEAIARAHPR